MERKFNPKNPNRAPVDTVFIHELRLPAWVGLHRHEKLAPQTIELDIEIALPEDSPVFRTGRVADTVDYAVVVARVRELLARERFGLVESVAERIAHVLLADFRSPRVRVRVAKPGVLREAGKVGVTVERNRPA